MATTNLPSKTDNKNFQALRTLLMDNPAAIVDALIIGLTEAGVQEMWDSETIELLLEPIQSALQQVYGVPLVGNTGEDGEALNYWRSIARALDIGYEEGYDEGDEPWPPKFAPVR